MRNTDNALRITLKIPDQKCSIKYQKINGCKGFFHLHPALEMRLFKRMINIHVIPSIWVKNELS